MRFLPFRPDFLIESDLPIAFSREDRSIFQYAIDEGGRFTEPQA
jgi:hypothetical protein